MEEARVYNLFYTCGPLPHWSQCSAHSNQKVADPVLRIHDEPQVIWQEPSKVYPEQGDTGCWHVPTPHPGHAAKQSNRVIRRTVQGHSAHQAARMPLPPGLAVSAPFP